MALLTSGGNGHPDYHDSSDVPARVQPALLGAVGQFVLQAAANLADETATPLPVPGRREACASLRFVAPDLDGQAPDGWRTVAPGTAVELESAIVAAARQFGRDEATTADASAEDQPPHIFAGARSASVAGNLPVLEGAAEVLGVGRLDVNGDDGVWVKDGLTAEGKAALKAMEQRGITLNLVRPSARLAADALATSSKPMLVSGMSSPDVALARRVAERHGVFALQCRVGELAVCAENLQTMRASLGGSANLLVSFHASAEDGVRASRALYHALRAKGWEKDEIYAIAGMTPDGDPGGNLSRFAAK